MVSSLLPLSLLSVLSCTTATLTKRGVQVSTNGVEGQTFDYIIVGGGLTGTTVAGRLTEDPNVTVLLVEAGPDDRTNPQVYDIYQYSNFFSTSLNWNWPVDQGQHIAGYVLSLFAQEYLTRYLSGKTLGGGSSINGAAYTRGQAEQYDAWTTLLESNESDVGWNWNSVFSYMKKVSLKRFVQMKEPNDHN
jgi:choline dehydrogenase